MRELHGVFRKPGSRFSVRILLGCRWPPSQVAFVGVTMKFPCFAFAKSLHSVEPSEGLARKQVLLLLIVIECTLPLVSWSQPATETVVVDKQTLQLMQQQIDELEARVVQLEAEKAGSPHAVAATSATQANYAPPSTGSHFVADTSAGLETYPVDAEKMDVSKTMLHIRGFADFGLYRASQKGHTTGFGLGELNLFVTSNISDKLKFLSEIVFENEGRSATQQNDFTVDVERALLQYFYNDHFNLAVGRYHTAIGYYNTAYHHSAWIQTALNRPFLFSFEDDGGILPIHQFGVSVSGEIPSGSLGLHYVAQLGNGRTTRNLINSNVEMVVDGKNDMAENFALYIQPESVPGLQAGFSNYRETLWPNSTERIAETIWDGYAVLTRRNFEWLTEGLVIRHSIFGLSHVYETTGFYTQLSKRYGSFTPYFLYQYVNAPVAEPIFPDVGLRTGPALGVRYDATASVAVKLQYDYSTLRKHTAINSLGIQVGFTF